MTYCKIRIEHEYTNSCSLQIRILFEYTNRYKTVLLLRGLGEAKEKTPLGCGACSSFLIFNPQTLI